ncbi:MAG: hypothetical protein IJE59_03135 [Clostridia bacterium]|nr:hypothetical protein [Clostridia bacterium]
MEQKILELYFIEKLKQKDIAEKLKISKYKVSRTVTKDFRYITEKEERKTKSKQKHSENTKRIVKRKREVLKFKNNLDDLVLKNMHNQASIELSKPKKLSNMAYRNWNKSAYTYNQKRRGFEFREELGRSQDVPKFIKVEV